MDSPRKGKPCGASYIPKARKCHTPTQVQPTHNVASTSAKVALALGLIAGGYALNKSRWTKTNDKELREALQHNKEWDVYARRNRENLTDPEVAMQRRMREAERREMCGRSDSPEDDDNEGEPRIDAFSYCSRQIGESSAYASIFLHPSEEYVFKTPQGNRSGSVSRAQAIRASRVEVRHMQHIAPAANVPVPKILGYQPKTGVIKMEYLKDYTTLRNINGYGGPRLSGEALSAVRQNYLKGVLAMHRGRIGHNDFHAGNIMVNPTTHDVRFIDFGLAESKRSDLGQNTHMSAIYRDVLSINSHIAKLTELPLTASKAIGSWLAYNHKAFLQPLLARKAMPDSQFNEGYLKYFLDLERVSQFMKTNNLSTISLKDRL